METLLSRHRNLTILVVLLFAQVLGLAIQVRRNSGSSETPARMIRLWVVSAITPFEKVMAGGFNWGGGIWQGYLDVRGTRDENRRLKESLAQLNLEQSRQTEDVAQARRLQTLLGFRRQYVAKTVPAQIIGWVGSDQSHIVFIDKGSRDHLTVDLPVITPDGVAGKVLEVYPSSSQVLLLNDPSSGVGAILEDSRLQGVVRGSANGELLLDKVMADETVHAGERVLTSGGDRIFPKGLLIGTIESSDRQKDVFLHVRVKPVAHLSNLEEVLVVTEVVQEQSTTNADSARALDVLTERLPQVPQKADTNADASKTPSAGTTGNSGAAANPATDNVGNSGTKAAASPAATKPSGSQVPKQGTKPGTKPKAVEVPR